MLRSSRRFARHATGMPAPKRLCGIVESDAASEVCRRRHIALYARVIAARPAYALFVHMVYALFSRHALFCPRLVAAARESCRHGDFMPSVSADAAMMPAAYFRSDGALSSSPRAA